jgi:dihydroxyacetone kinase-like protein
VTGSELVDVLERALASLDASCDELRDLDADLGDGDMGITVRKGSAAVRAKLAELDDPSPAVVLRTAGAAFASANPSTLAALVGGALLAAAKAVADAGALTLEEARAVGRAAADSIAARGKAELGDKTILDALVPSVDAIDEGPDAMVDAARAAVDETTAQRSQRGRASWLGERSMGRQDPGATAYLRFLEALSAALDQKGST